MVWSSLIVYIFFLVFSGALSATETAVLMLPSGRIHRLVESERAGAEALEKLDMRRHRLRAVSALVAGAAFGATVAFALQLATLTRLPIVFAIVFSVLGVLLTHALAQALPRTLAVANPEEVGLRFGPSMSPVVRTIYPLARVLGAPWKWAMSLAADERPTSPWAVTPEWRSVEHDEEERESTEEALLGAVSDFAEKVVREVMVPRTDVTALEDTVTLQEAVETIVATGYTRVPVYHETIDDVRGVLYAKDLLGIVGDAEAEWNIVAISREPYFVPETKPLEELLVEMRKRTHIAIIADEYGGMAGIVTLEDLLEEIVGDIADEYDTEEPLVVDAGDGRFRVDARLPIDDLNELFGTDIDSDADSVGGLVAEVTGKIPDVGEGFDIEGLRLTVTELEGTRIREITAQPSITSEETEDEQANPA